MDWVGPATTATVAIVVGVYLDRRARRLGAIEAQPLRRILLIGGLLLVGVAAVVSRLTA